jgi:hypothetical protein
MMKEEVDKLKRFYSKDKEMDDDSFSEMRRFQCQ